MVFIVKIPNRGGSATGTPSSTQDDASSPSASTSSSSPSSSQPSAYDDAASRPSLSPSPGPSTLYPSLSQVGVGREPAAAPTQSKAAPPRAVVKDEAPPLAAFDGLSLLAEAAAAGSSDLTPASTEDPVAPVKQEEHVPPGPAALPAPAQSLPVPSQAASPSPPSTSALDVIVAPAVLQHRFVRSTDTSMIVERPERIRAVLLGLAALMGRIHAGDAVVTAGGGSGSTESEPEKSGAGDDSLDILTGQLAGMSMSRDPTSKGTSSGGDINVFVSNKALPLSSADAALAMAHAHPDERLEEDETLLSAYAKRKGGLTSSEEEVAQGKAPSYGVLDYIDYLARLCADSPAQPPPPKPKTLRTPRGGKRSTAQSPVKPPPAVAPPMPGAEVANAAVAPLSKDIGEAPSTPKANAVADPMLHAEFSTPKPVEAPSVSLEDEGEDHLSEIPEHMPQGDLYLAGPDPTAAKEEAASRASFLTFGSGLAISHALGAVCLAVDRIVAGSASPGAGVKTEDENPSSDEADVTRLLSSSSTTNQLSSTSGPSPRAFVLTRPPGHHCSATIPSGFCWVNNAIVAACHAYHTHGIDRVVILDIDLHHGNGTQSLAWRINSETAASDLARDAQLEALHSAALEKRRLAARGGTRSKAAAKSAAAAPTTEEAEPTLEELAKIHKAPKRGLKIFYGSLHDIESFPCEDGNPELVRDASTVVEGAHGQWIVNVHLETAGTRTDFDRLYASKYTRLVSSASTFLSTTSSHPSRTLILISAGFDANSLEYASMQRHGKSVPPIFYERFGREVRGFAERWAQGRTLSVLEGGYSDRALCSGALAHLAGLAGVRVTSATSAAAPVTDSKKPDPTGGATQAKRRGSEWDHETALEEWWTPENLSALEALGKRVDKALPPPVASGTAPSSGAKSQAGQTPLGKPLGATGASATASGSGKRRGPDPYKDQPWLAATADHFLALQSACARR